MSKRPKEGELIDNYNTIEESCKINLIPNRSTTVYKKIPPISPFGAIRAPVKSSLSIRTNNSANTTTTTTSDLANNTNTNNTNNVQSANTSKSKATFLSPSPKKRKINNNQESNDETSITLGAPKEYYYKMENVEGIPWANLDVVYLGPEGYRKPIDILLPPMFLDEFGGVKIYGTNEFLDLTKAAQKLLVDQNSNAIRSTEKIINVTENTNNSTQLDYSTFRDKGGDDNYMIYEEEKEKEEEEGNSDINSYVTLEDIINSINVEGGLNGCVADRSNIDETGDGSFEVLTQVPEEPKESKEPKKKSGNSKKPDEARSDEIKTMGFEFKESIGQIADNFGRGVRLIAKELNRHAIRGFGIVWYPHFVKDLFYNISPHARNFHECIKEEEPCRLYVDIDLKLSSSHVGFMSKMEKDKRWQSLCTIMSNHALVFIRSLLNSLEDAFEFTSNITFSSRDSFKGSCVMLQSSDHEKYSLHIIFKLDEDRILFKNRRSVGNFVESVVHKNLFENTFFDPYNSPLRPKNSNEDDICHPLITFLKSKQKKDDSDKWNFVKNYDETNRTKMVPYQFFLHCVDQEIYYGNSREFRMFASTKFGQNRPMKLQKVVNFQMGLQNQRYKVTSLSLGDNKKINNLVYTPIKKTTNRECTSSTLKNQTFGLTQEPKKPNSIEIDEPKSYGKDYEEFLFGGAEEDNKDNADNNENQFDPEKEFENDKRCLSINTDDEDFEELKKYLFLEEEEEEEEEKKEESKEENSRKLNFTGNLTHAERAVSSIREISKSILKDQIQCDFDYDPCDGLTEFCQIFYDSLVVPFWHPRVTKGIPYNTIANKRESRYLLHCLEPFSENKRQMEDCFRMRRETISALIEKRRKEMMELGIAPPLLSNTSFSSMKEKRNSIEDSDEEAEIGIWEYFTTHSNNPFSNLECDSNSTSKEIQEYLPYIINELLGEEAGDEGEEGESLYDVNDMMGTNLIMAIASNIELRRKMNYIPSARLQFVKETANDPSGGGIGGHYLYYIAKKYKRCQIKELRTGDPEASHSSNNIYFYVRLNDYQFFQKCYNKECKNYYAQHIAGVNPNDKVAFKKAKKNTRGNYYTLDVSLQNRIEKHKRMNKAFKKLSDSLFSKNSLTNTTASS